MSCEDFLEFQDYLKKSRDMDDKLVYILNSSLPTESFAAKTDLPNKCKDLFTKLEANFENRNSSIKHCITVSSENMKNLKLKQDSNPDDTNIMKSLKKEQTKVRLLKTELGAEEVVKNRSLKLFHERCRAFYKPENLAL